MKIYIVWSQMVYDENDEDPAEIKAFRQQINAEVYEHFLKEKMIGFGLRTKIFELDVPCE